MSNYSRLLILYLITLPALAADVMTSEEQERWFNDDSDDESRALAVNEGELVFLSQPVNKAIHHSTNTLYIDESSIETGWVKLSQYHAQLDAVAASQIVYRYKHQRNLSIVSSSGIQRAWIEGNSVQLSEIQRNAKLCVAMEVGILHVTPTGAILRNGPFHRQFLDGFYPMHVTLDIHYPANKLEITAIKPTPQAGFTATHFKNRVLLDAWFEGKLNTEVHFSLTTNNKAQP